MEPRDHQHGSRLVARSPRAFRPGDRYRHREAGTLLAQRRSPEPGGPEGRPDPHGTRTVTRYVSEIQLHTELNLARAVGLAVGLSEVIVSHPALLAGTLPVGYSLPPLP